MNSARVGIIGAGLAGLNAAHVLNRAGIDNEIYEASDRIGGRITSDLIDGYICDRGFQVVNPAYSELLETGIARDLGIRALPKGARIHLNGTSILVGDPRSSLRYWSGDLSRRSGSLLEKLHFFQYLMAKTEDLTFSAAMNDCGGFFDDVLSPFLTGVFLTSPSEMSNQMARELIHWFIKGRPGLPRGGVKRLPELLADGANIHLNAEVELLTNRSIRVNGRSEEFDAIIVAADPISACQLLDLPRPKTSGCITWYHSCDAGTLSEKEIQIPTRSAIVNSVVLSNTAPEYAPSGKQLIATTALVEVPDGELHSELNRIWRQNTDKWELVKRDDITSALPFHPPGQELLQPIQFGSGVYVAGDWRSIPAQQGALLTGRLAAQRVIGELQVR